MHPALLALLISASAPTGGAAAPPLAKQPPGEAPATTWGEPDLAKMRRLFKQRFPELKRCYEAALQKDAASRGKFTLRFTVVESGALRRVRSARSTFARPDVPRCVAEVVRRWRTPFRPAQPVEVEFPFAFSPR